MNRYLSKALGVMCMAGLLSPITQASDEGLLGVQVGFPKFNFTSQTDEGATFDGTTMTVESTATFLTLTAGDTAQFVFNGNLSIALMVDSAGDIVPDVGNVFSLSGDVGGDSGVLLEGTVIDFGLLDMPSSPTDFMDVRLAVTGGALAGLYTTTEAGAVITLEGSSFAGFASTWGATDAKGDLGPIPDPGNSPGTATIGYWKTHPEAWPVTSVSIGGISISQGDAISILKTPTRGDKTISMAKQLIAAILNVAAGNDDSCIADTIDASDLWLIEHGGVGSGQRQWDEGDLLHDDLDAYNNGALCAPHRD